MLESATAIKKYLERKVESKYTGCVKIGYENTRISSISEGTFSEFVFTDTEDSLSILETIIKDCIIPESVGLISFRMNEGHLTGVSYTKGFRGHAAYEYIMGRNDVYM